jgi:hypothetical protein
MPSQKQLERKQKFLATKKAQREANKAKEAAGKAQKAANQSNRNANKILEKRKFQPRKRNFRGPPRGRVNPDKGLVPILVRPAMVQAVANMIANPGDYPTIRYNDGSTSIETATAKPPRRYPITFTNDSYVQQTGYASKNDTVAFVFRDDPVRHFITFEPNQAGKLQSYDFYFSSDQISQSAQDATQDWSIQPGLDDMVPMPIVYADGQSVDGEWQPHGRYLYAGQDESSEDSFIWLDASDEHNGTITFTYAPFDDVPGRTVDIEEVFWNGSKIIVGTVVNLTSMEGGGYKVKMTRRDKKTGKLVITTKTVKKLSKVQTTVVKPKTPDKKKGSVASIDENDNSVVQTEISLPMDSETLPIDAPGYYAFRAMIKLTGDDATPFVWHLTNMNYSSVSASWAHLTAKDYSANSYAAKAIRMLAADLRFTMTEQTINRQGKLSAYQVPPGQTWFNWTLLGFDAVASKNGAEPMKMEDGFHGFVKPSSGASWALEEPCIFGTGNLPIASKFSLLPRDGFLVLWMLSDSTAARSGYFVQNCAFEYDTDDTWRVRGKTTISQSEFAEGVQAASKMPQFTDNPSHLAKLFAAAKNATRSVLRGGLKAAPGIIKTMEGLSSIMG